MSLLKRPQFSLWKWNLWLFHDREGCDILPSVALLFSESPKVLLRVSSWQTRRSSRSEFGSTNFPVCTIPGKFPQVFREDSGLLTWSVAHTFKVQKQSSVLLFTQLSFDDVTHKHWWKIFGILHDRFRCTFGFFSFSMYNKTLPSVK